MIKFIKCFLVLLISAFVMVPLAEAKSISITDGISMMAYSVTTDFDRDDDDFSTNCEDFAHTIRIGGYLVLLVRVLLPIIIIAKSTMSLISVVTNGKPEELQKKAKQLGVSLIAGILIFFVPTIINVIFGFISDYNNGITEDSKICTACIFDPLGSTCSTYAD